MAFLLFAYLDLSKAEQVYNRLIFVDKSFINAFVWRGLIRYKMKKINLAMADYQRALTILARKEDLFWLAKINFLKAECYRYNYDEKSAMISYEISLPSLEDYIDYIERLEEEKKIEKKSNNLLIDNLKVDLNYDKRTESIEYKLQKISTINHEQGKLVSS